MKWVVGGWGGGGGGGGGGRGRKKCRPGPNVLDKLLIFLCHSSSKFT